MIVTGDPGTPPPRVKVLWIPGHSPETSGAWSDGIDEDEEARRLGLAVDRALQGHPGIESKYQIIHGTKPEYILGAINAAREWKPDLSVNIHLNCVEDRSANGTEVYYSRHGLAIQAANGFLYELAKIFRRRRDPFYRDDLGVLVHAPCPTVYLEVCFISCPTDVVRLQGHRSEIINGLIAAAENFHAHFFGENNRE